jgi:hypothetical protein
MMRLMPDAEYERLSVALRARAATIAAKCAGATGDSETVMRETETALPW